MRTDTTRAQDIREAIVRIESRSRLGKDAYTRDEMLQVWVIHHLEIIGEAAKGLSEEYRAAHPGIPWQNIGRMRDRLIHSYWKVDPEVVWTVVEKDLPPLKTALNS